jgi:hypothetical protein
MTAQGIYVRGPLQLERLLSDNLAALTQADGEVPLIRIPATTSWRAEEQDDGEWFPAQTFCFAFF